MLLSIISKLHVLHVSVRQLYWHIGAITADVNNEAQVRAPSCPTVRPFSWLRDLISPKPEIDASPEDMPIAASAVSGFMLP